MRGQVRTDDMQHAIWFFSWLYIPFLVAVLEHGQVGPVIGRMEMARVGHWPCLRLRLLVRLSSPRFVVQVDFPVLVVGW